MTVVVDQDLQSMVQRHAHTAACAAGPEQKLEVSLAGGAYEPIGLRGKPTQTYEETLEINPAY